MNLFMRSFKLILKFFFWAFCVWVVLASLEWIFSKALMYNKDLKSSYVATTKINADVLIMGSCEALSAINPSIIEQSTAYTAYNLATNHSLPSELFALLHLYLQNNEAPKFILIHLSEESFDSRYQTFNSFRFTHFNDSIIQNVIKTKDPNYFNSFKFPFLKYALRNDLYLHKVKEGIMDEIFNSKPLYPNGYHYRPYKQFISHQELTNKYGNPIVFNNDSLEMTYFSQLIDLCFEKNIYIIPYKFPIWSGMDKILKNKSATHEIEALLEQYNIELLNLDYCYEDSNLFYRPFRLKNFVCDSLVERYICPLLVE